jgi:hypothetical protein
MPQRIDRRELLSLAAGAGACLLVAPVGTWLGAEPRRGEREEVLMSLAELPGVQLVGEGYMAARPEEATSVGLERAVGSLADLGATIRDDFEHGRIVRIEGWALSVTEARLCSLAVLVGVRRKPFRDLVRT